MQDHNPTSRMLGAIAPAFEHEMAALRGRWIATREAACLAALEAAVAGIHELARAVVQHGPRSARIHPALEAVRQQVVVLAHALDAAAARESAEGLDTYAGTRAVILQLLMALGEVEDQIACPLDCWAS